MDIYIFDNLLLQKVSNKSKSIEYKVEMKV